MALSDAQQAAALTLARSLLTSGLTLAQLAIDRQLVDLLGGSSGGAALPPLPGNRVVGTAYNFSIEGWAANANGSDAVALLSPCWSSITVLAVPTSLDGTTAAGKAAIQQQFNIEPVGPQRYFVVVEINAVWVGGAACT